MPYIDPYQRTHFSWEIGDLAEKISKESPEKKAGVINYCFSLILNLAYKKPNYKDFNEMIGILECCKMELYRRMVAPYEDKKKEANGDVYFL